MARPIPTRRIPFTCGMCAIGWAAAAAAGPPEPAPAGGDPEADVFAACAMWVAPAAPGAEAAGTADPTPTNAFDAIAAAVPTAGDGVPILVFNSLGWRRTEEVRVSLPEGYPPAGPCAVVEVAGGRETRARLGEGGREAAFHAADVPPVGYRLFRLVFREPTPDVAAPPAGERAEGRRAALERARPLIARAVSPHRGWLPVSYSFLRLEPASVAVERVRREGDTLVLDLHELESREAHATVFLPAAAARAETSGAGPVVVDGPRVRVRLAAQEAAQVRVVFPR